MSELENKEEIGSTTETENSLDSMDRPEETTRFLANGKKPVVDDAPREEQKAVLG